MSASTAVPSSQHGAPASAQPNGIQKTDAHGRKPSAVITASGTSGQMPNGAPLTPSTGRPNISFGSMSGPQASSPASSVAVPFASQTSNMPPTKSEMPHPMASGGRPPALSQGHSNTLNFGSMGVDTTDSNYRNPLSQTPLGSQQSPHSLGREPSQSGHSDMSGNGMHTLRNGYMNQGAGGRGRGGGGGAGGGAHMSHQYPGAQSPAQSYRQLPNNRGQQSTPSQFQNQPSMGTPGYRGRNSPAMMHVQPHIPQAANGSPQMHYLGAQQNAMYGLPSQYDPYAGYYQPYYLQSQYPQGAPSSPRPNQHYPQPYGGPPAQMQSPYHPPPMSRSASQLSERPVSSLGSRPQGSAPSSSIQGPTTGPSSAPPTTPSASSTTFKIPPRNKSKAIVIKNAEGKEIHFDKKTTQAPSATPSSPAIVTSTKAPSPAPAVQAPPSPAIIQHTRNESKSNPKTDEEIKTGFQEQVKKQLEAQREQEKKLKEAEQPTSGQAGAPTPAVVKETPLVTPIVTKLQSPVPSPAGDKQPELASASAPTQKSAAVSVPPTPIDDKVIPASSTEDEAARLKREEDERLEREIAEMEAAEKEEEERERKYKESKAAQIAEKKKRDAAKPAGPTEEELKALEREAEEREIVKEKERQNPQDVDETTKADKDMFAALKKPTLGPGAAGASSEPIPAEPTVTEPTKDDQGNAPASIEQSRHAPSMSQPPQLNLGTEKPSETLQPTPGMRSLESARLLGVPQESVKYPEGIKSPSPSQNSGGGARTGRAYDKGFLMQFQNVFKEKPTIDWEQKVKDTLNDGESGSARGGQGRAPSNTSGRQSSRGQQASSFGGVMGSFAGGNTARTLPPNTTSQERFQASMSQSGRPSGGNALGGFPARPGGFPMGGQSMSRTNSIQTMAQSGQRSNTRGKGGSKRGADRTMSRKEDESSNKSMPLTAGMELKSLEKSSTGWKSSGPAGASNAVGPDGMMQPEMVQRKVKAALNKMTPEKFDKISDEIMKIASQSQKEADGRTLRQVIALTFEKACDEAHWAGMYAKFCLKMLTMMSPNIVDENVTDRQGTPIVGGALFRKYLLNRCQDEFERGWQANLPDKGEGDSEEAALLSDEYYIAAAAKRRGLGLIQFIGELYKLEMLTDRIMHSCVKKLLDFEGEPDEAAIENLSKLLRTIGKQMDTSGPQAHGVVDVYIDRINKILEGHPKMPSRSRFMLMDVLDLRRSGWNDTTTKGPKTIQEIHAEAQAAAEKQEAERARQSQRGGHGRMPERGDARGYGHQGMPPPQDYSRTQVGVSDLKWLQNRGGQPRQPSQGLGPSLGPGSSLFAGRSASGRKAPTTPKDGETSSSTSRTATPITKKDEKDESTSTNTFSALAALESENTDKSPPGSARTSPQMTQAMPAISIDEAVSKETAPPPS